MKPVVSSNMEQVLSSILIHLGQVVPYSSACIYLLEQERLRAVAARGLKDPAHMIGRDFPADDQPTRAILETRKPLILEDVPANSPLVRPGSNALTRSWMGVPLVVREEAIGYMALDSQQIAAYGDREATLAQAFAGQAAITIENARLFAETQRLLEHSQKQALRLQQIMDIVPEGIFLLNAERRVIVANRAAKAYLAQLAGSGVGQIITHLGTDPLDRILQTASETIPWREVTTAEARHIFEVSVRPLAKESEGSIWLLVMRNVTAVRKQERYLQAQERLATVGQLAAGIAHDFNNIMAVISLYTQLVLRAPELASKDEERLYTIQEQSERAANLIRQILDFSRQTFMDRKPLDLRTFLKELTLSVQQDMPESIRLRMEFQPGEYLISADQARLQLAIGNLVRNACEAMPVGGDLVLRLGFLILLPDRPFPLPDLTAGHWIRLEISDTGSGIERKDLPHVFEPFFSTKRIGQRAGLELAQVYGIVKQHDGYIDVESDPGQGTTFTIYLPSFTRPADVREIPKAGRLVAGGGETILVVEDDRPTREALAELISMLNYRVLTAANGVEALAIIDENPGQVELVVSDMVMPVMGGATLYTKMREKQPDAKMIVVTGYPLEKGGQELLDQGIVAYVQKPLRVEEIAEAVREALNI
jgi:signal transduction histidine kinase/CheY-like chemotaxis protein